jgi:hypothetical protein
MMLTFEVGPPPWSIRKGLKQHPIRGSHNDCQRCKMSKRALADTARLTIRAERGVHFGSIADVAYSLATAKKTGRRSLRSLRPYVIAGRRGLGGQRSEY